MSYLCNGKRPCKHFDTFWDAFTMINGDSYVSNPQWRCNKRDDERCVPDCELYEDKRKVVKR